MPNVNMKVSMKDLEFCAWGVIKDKHSYFIEGSMGAARVGEGLSKFVTFYPRKKDGTLNYSNPTEKFFAKKSDARRWAAESVVLLNKNILERWASGE